MKRIKNIVMLGVAAIGISLTTSCDDQLSALPTQSKVDGNVIVDQKSAIATLNGIYYQFAQCGTDNYAIQSTLCVSAYEVYPANIAGVISYYQGPYLFEMHGSDSYSRYASYIWTPFYATMTAINGVIAKVTEAEDSWFTENKKQEILAEAYCMRAVVNSNLLRYFGYSWDLDSPYGNILRTEAQTSKNLPCPRSNVKDTYTAIFNDLDFAIQYGAETSDNYHVNQWVAKGQKARMLMIRGAEGDYEEAAKLALDIIDNSPYALEDYSVDIFHNKGLKSKEVMFGIQPQTSNGQQTNVMEAYYYRNAPQYNHTSNFQALFENDPRKNDLIRSVMGQSLVYEYDDKGNYTGYHWENVPMSVVCKHFSADHIIASEVEETGYMMRLSEMYMLRAEALVRANGTAGLADAKSLLKTILGHAGYTDFSEVDALNDTQSFLALYFKEYIRQFYCECGLEMDIMHRMPKEIVYPFNPEYYNAVYDESGEIVSVGDEKFGASIFGIPSDEFKNNHQLTNADQNPGYATN